MRATILVLAFVALSACSAQENARNENDAKNAASQAGAAVDRAVHSKPAQQLKESLLAASIKARLAASDLDATTNVRVGVSGGVATLSGRVHSAGEKTKLVEETRQISGVKSVVDELVVDRNAPTARATLDDVALETRIRAAIAGEAGANAFRLKIAAKAGVVTLGGAVATAALKETIVATARKTPGVRSLSESIAVHE